MNTSTERRVAVIGLGSMGGAMAATLHKAGWKVTGFDPSETARTAVSDAGIVTTASVEDLAGSPLRGALTARGQRRRINGSTTPGVTGNRRDHRHHNLRTGNEQADGRTRRGARRSVRRCPGLWRPRRRINRNTLSAFVGATDAALAAAEPVLLALTGGKYNHIGEPGSGNVVKLLNNVLAAANLVSVGEALGVAKAYGIDPAKAAASISEASGGSKVSANMYPNWVLSGTHDSGFSLGLMARDASLAVDVAAQIGENPALLAAVAGQWQEALAALGARADFTEIARTVAPAITPAGRARKHKRHRKRHPRRRLTAP
jgi:3-hydroxyisobutyrate dehydrogenase